ncbi:hypothetical protein [Siminovitchia fortis]|uniref:hypothetical protein n=1 Tax=Siminovitchia fortis TaxID=254758 RepID=UPI0011A1665A|nr:hypothetical protein [Siminovitchia fortis]
MKTIANFYFLEDGKSTVNFYNGSLVELLENKLDVDVNKLKRAFFVAKVVPVFVFCGASVVTQNVGKNKVFSYEVHVEDEESFFRNMNEFIESFVNQHL